jgi:hypothetical protein
MKGDFTRFTFQSTNHYSSVRSQQGRVQVDADWNEAIDILAHWDRTTRRDVIGLCGGPQGQDSAGNDLAGFLVRVVDGDLRITKGRYYVDGLLVENEQEVVITAQPDLPYLQENTLQDVLVPSGEALASGTYLAYLDVWERHITALEDATIREVALGGPDTTTRIKVVWQVRLMLASGLEEAENAPPNCASALPLWDKVTAPSSGRLSARAEPGEADTDPCEVPARAGFRGLENQLYRVEVHRVISDNEITIKWSRENGSVVFGWTGQDPLNPNKLTLSSTERDDVLGLTTDDWVELTDDKHELRSEPGLLVKVVNVEGNVLTIDPGSETVDIREFPVNSKVRRWDMPRDVGEISVDLTLADNWIALENGVEVKLEPGTYRMGDYWLIPARTAMRDIEWPRNEANDPLPQPPHGIQHHYCRLALLSFDGEIWERLSDCRNLFPPLTEMIRFFHVAGDGQEALPGQAVPRPLQVAVANGQRPVAGARVRFEVVGGNGLLQTAGEGPCTDFTTGGTSPVEVETGPDGVAACCWRLDAATLSQRVEATLRDIDGKPLVDGADTPLLTPIRFNANLSMASQVAYNPESCPDLSGVTTVQEAIDKLCQMGDREPGIHIVDVALIADVAPPVIDAPLRNDTEIPVAAIANGILVMLDTAIDPNTVRDQNTGRVKPICFVTLDIPYPMSGADRDLWRFDAVIGFQPIILEANIEVVNDNKHIWWRPTDNTQRWLQGSLFQVLTQVNRAHILAHLTLKGNFIWDQDNPETPKLYLDGEAFGFRRSDATNTDLRRTNDGFLSGDGRRGGDFEMWFWLVPPTTPTLTTTVPTTPTLTVPTLTLTVTGPTLTTTIPTLTAPTLTIITQPGPRGIPTRPGGATAPTAIVPRRGRGGAARGGTPLTSVRGIGEASARRLTGAGIRTAEALAVATPDQVATALGFSSRAQAQGLIDEAKRLLGQS